MAQKDAIKKLTDYFKVHNIDYETSVDNGCMQFVMSYDAENAPGRYIESCIWFYEDAAEARVYYNAMGAEICGKSEHITGLLRLLNFINARVFLSCSDGYGKLYEPHMLYTPRIYLTEDGLHDISITTMINYDFWEVAPVETADYLTAYCPELINRLAPAIFGVLLGQLTAEDGIVYIKEQILEEG